MIRRIHMRAKTFRKTLSVAIFLILLPLVIDGAQAQTGGLRFVTPLDGETVEPGQTFAVEVAPEPGVTPSLIGIMSRPIVAFRQQSPFAFTVSYPEGVALGPKRFIAEGLDVNGNPLRVEITLNVETSTPVTSIRVNPPFFVAAEETISVSGTFTDGVTREITRSRETAYLSSNPEVSTISPDGLIQPVENGSATITVTYKNQAFSFPIQVDFTPVGRVELLCAYLLEIVESNPGTPLADKVEDARAECATALNELTKKPPDKQAALGNIEGAVGDLEAAVGDGLLDSTQGTRRMDQLARTSRQLAQEVLDQAIAQGGDSVVIADAQQTLAEGDTLRESGAFKDAVSKYKDALAKAEGAIS